MTMKMPPKNLLNALNENKNSIYVWVMTRKGVRCSMKVSYPDAMEWVIQVAKNENGDVPYFINGHDVFLGDISYMI